MRFVAKSAIMSLCRDSTVQPAIDADLASQFDAEGKAPAAAEVVTCAEKAR